MAELEAENARLKAEIEGIRLSERVNYDAGEQYIASLKKNRDVWRQHAGEFESKLAKAREGLINIRNELGIPQPGYPQPVANAAELAQRTLAEIGE